MNLPGQAAPPGVVVAMMAPPTPLRPVANSMVAAGWLTAAGVIIAVGAVVALRRPEAAAALAFRAGYAAGVAWARLRGFGARLLATVRRMIE
jgi:hypothetical protein